MTLTNKALIVTDLQNDFCEGGSLEVDGSRNIAEPVNTLIELFDLVVACQDWHPVDHISFTTRGGPWPPHCIQNTWGADITNDIDQSSIAKVFKKADQPDAEAYSAFDGTGMADFLRQQGVVHIYVAGLTTDYCVRTTVLDGIREGFEVTVARDAIRAVNVRPNDGAEAIAEMEDAGAQLSTSEEIIRSLERHMGAA